MKNKARIPDSGSMITNRGGKVRVPDDPVIPFIEGDGIGRDITPPSLKLLDAAVAKAFGGAKRVHWMEIFAGEKAKELYGEYLPDETVDLIRRYAVAIKGPLTTPVGGGFRSLNVTLRQVLDLYSCVRPVKHIPGVAAPVVRPDSLDVVIFRENTEDVYAGYEWPAGSPEAEKLSGFLKDNFRIDLHPTTALGLKPISEYATKRLVRAAVEYMVRYKRKSLTLVHKGNIMKFTEGAFKTWGYEVALEEFGNLFITETDCAEKHGGNAPQGKLVVKDRIADNMLQQVLTRPEDFDVIALPNLNGDYLSDACAAQVGGLGMAPGANIGDAAALFEATHGTAPKHAGKNKANPTSLILSGIMMLRYLGWDRAAGLIMDAVTRTIAAKTVTYDLARHMGIEPVSTSEYVDSIIKNL